MAVLARKKSKEFSQVNELTGYYRQISKTELLTAEQEKALARRVQEGDQDAKIALAEANLRLVVKVARKFIGPR